MELGKEAAVGWRQPTVASLELGICAMKILDPMDIYTYIFFSIVTSDFPHGLTLRERSCADHFG